ncbi:DUF6710 family protein [Snodgrassella alvi]|uniref:DUF6710 family protein n=1 Tax=Snodgrassella alvi TaxID=1196083 RepID=UPI000C1F1BE3|nr:DUF6710 family protein [Snodgrassella alvi]PIT14051.1 hypothetical protein BGI33_08265 [Snodgrassella alvi]PIT16133.1 hypothetical protein BGI34_10365 [Snodgrassella alvi]
MHIIYQKKNDALHDLIKIIMRPIQAEHIRNAYLNSPHCAITEIKFPMDFFGFFPTDQEIKSKNLSHEDSLEKYSLKLSSDIVLPTCWHPSSLICNLGSIGHQARPGGEFTQSGNHSVVLILPMMIGIVTGGNHSITQGILTGNGEISPSDLIDLSDELNKIYFNGKHWISSTTNQIIGSPRYPEFGWIWEIAKLLTK